MDQGSLVPAPDQSRATLALAAGDVVLIVVFVVAGEVRHYPLELVPTRTPGTLAPFLVGWVLGSLLAGAYTTRTRTVPAAAVGRTVVAWAIAVAVAGALRATQPVQGETSPTLLAVSLGVGLVLLVPWRLAVTRFARR